MEKRIIDDKEKSEMLKGKTIEKIQRLTNLAYSEDTVRIVFTDGSCIEISGEDNAYEIIYTGSFTITI